MDRRKVNRDFKILGAERVRLASLRRPAWSRHTWRELPDGSFELFLFDYPLPANARPASTHLKIEGRKNLYDPAGIGQYHFYRNAWVADTIRVLYPGRRKLGPLPRVFAPDQAGWYYLCVHPGTVRGDENILSFLRILDLFVKNADPDIW